MAKHTKSLLPLLLLQILIAALAFSAYQYLTTPVTTAKTPLQFRIPEGQSLNVVAQRLRERGLLPDAWRFILLARIKGQAASIQSGVYRIKEPMTPPQLLNLLVRGDRSLEAFTLVEGWNWRQVRAALDRVDYLERDLAGLPEAEIARRLGVQGEKIEGWLFPDTYHIARGAKESDLLRAARETMERRLQEAWQARAPDLPYASPYEALIMASIVEKETGSPQDRRLVAAVFVNRLRHSMRLQTDPTVIYGLGESFDGNLRKRDLQTDTPYNSYTRHGLPPTPIAMPGRASLEAALNPASDKVFYFVARGDGTSEFSATLEEHNQAVNRYQRRKQP